MSRVLARKHRKTLQELQNTYFSRLVFQQNTYTFFPFFKSYVGKVYFNVLSKNIFMLR